MCNNSRKRRTTARNEGLMASLLPQLTHLGITDVRWVVAESRSVQGYGEYTHGGTGCVLRGDTTGLNGASYRMARGLQEGTLTHAEWLAVGSYTITCVHGVSAVLKPQNHAKHREARLKPGTSCLKCTEETGAVWARDTVKNTAMVNVYSFEHNGLTHFGKACSMQRRVYNEAGVDGAQYDGYALQGLQTTPQVHLVTCNKAAKRIETYLKTTYGVVERQPGALKSTEVIDPSHNASFDLMLAEAVNSLICP